MNYLVLALGAAVCFAIGQILNKVMSKHSIDNPNSLFFFFALTTFAFGLLLIPFVPWVLPSLEVFKLLAVAVPIFLCGSYLFCHGVYQADASSFAPLFQLQAGLVGLLAFVFLGERFPVENYVWMGALLAGAILVSFDEKMSLKSFMNKGIVLILLMQVCHAVSNIFIGMALKSVTAVQFLFWENMVIGVLCLLFWLVKRPRITYSTAQIAPMFVTSFVTGLGILLLLTAFQQNLTISSVLGLLSAPLVFVISLIASRVSPTFLEHHSNKVYAIRAIGLVIILIGAIKISLG